MFEAGSRYYSLETAVWTSPGGSEHRYVRRRFLPREDDRPPLARAQVGVNDRLDRLTFRVLGDPEQFWRICDDNGAMHPDEMTVESGRWLVVREAG